MEVSRITSGLERKISNASKAHDASPKKMLEIVRLLADIYGFPFYKGGIGNDCISLTIRKLNGSNAYLKIDIWYHMKTISTHIADVELHKYIDKRVPCTILHIIEFLDEIGVKKNIPIMKIAQPANY